MRFRFASALLLSAAVASVPAVAHATTINIDFLGVPTTQLLTSTNSYSEYGFTISSNSQFYENVAQGDPPPGIDTANPGTADTFTISDGGALFALDSFSISTQHATNTSPDTYAITGTGGTPFSIAATGVYSGPFTTNGNVVTNYETINLPTADASDYVTSISFTVDTQSGTYAYIDNLAITPTPEPSSLLLLGTGVLGAAGAIRRKLMA